MIKNTSSAYGSVAKFLHWLIAVLLIGMLTFGYFLDDIPKDYKGMVYNIHKLTGLTILTLMVIRVLWALINPRPKLPRNTPLWQRIAARATHDSLYFFAILMPLAGWIGSSAAEKYPHLGSFQFKLPVPHEKSMIELSFNVHETVAIILIAFISLHVLAAFYHHYVKKDDVMRRMM